MECSRLLRHCLLRKKCKKWVTIDLPLKNGRLPNEEGAGSTSSRDDAKQWVVGISLRSSPTMHPSIHACMHGCTNGLILNHDPSCWDRLEHPFVLDCPMLLVDTSIDTARRKSWLQRRRSIQSHRRHNGHE